MTIQEKFDGYVTLRQIHRQVFQALEEYRRQHVDFRFAVRKKDKENKLSCGLIFPGNNAYIEVGLSNERDVMNKTSTVFLMFSIQNNSVSAISLNVAYSALTDNDIQKVEKYAGLCRIFNCEPRFVGNNRRIRTSVAIPMNGGDWRQTLQEWLSQNFSVLTRELDGVCLSQDEFDEMLENQVNRGILRRDDDGYSVNEQYVPKLAEVTGDGQEREDADDVGDEEDSDEIGCVMMGFGKNYIVFGAPGTGKSYKLNKAVNQWFVDAEGKRFERVTFYPTYS